MPAAHIDESLLALFRSEAEAQSLALVEALAQLGAGHDADRNTLAAMAATRALKSAALLVGLELAAQLAEAMEQVLAQCVERHQPPGPDTLRAVEAAGMWLAQFSLFTAEEMARPSTATFEGHARTLAALQKAAVAESAGDKTSGNAKGKTPSEVLGSPAPPPSARLDFSLLDLYRSEAETQVSALARDMVELEHDLANPKKIEPIMRAAHSLKGAARIIGLDAVVQLAHAMEDALVAAQQGRLALDANAVDVLLRAGDWIGQFSQLPQEQLAAPPSEQLTMQAQCLAGMQAILRGEPVKAVTKENKASTAPAPSVTPEVRKTETATAGAEAVVRVSAASLSRLMGLAAETLVEARRLEPFRDQLLKLKNQQMHFVAKLEAALQASAGDADLASLSAEAQDTLAALRGQLESFDAAARRTTLVSGRLYQEVIASRLRPFGEGTQQFPRLVRDVCRQLGKQARLEIEGRNTPVDRDILEKLEAPLSHLLTNACDHGLEAPATRTAAGKPEAGTIRLEARHRAGMLMVQVSDDGGGIPVAKLREKIVAKSLTSAEAAAAMTEDEVLQFLFLPGFSTADKITEISGRGVGLDVVQSLVREVGGTVRIFTTAGRGTVFSLQLPVTRSVMRALLAEVDGGIFAFPLTRIHRALRSPCTAIENVGGQPQLSVDGVDAALIDARRVLGLPPTETKNSGDIASVIIGGGRQFFALEVDRLLGECDLVVRPLDPRLGKVPGIQAVALGENGEPILIVDVEDLRPRLEKIAAGAPEEADDASARKRVLVVDDSATVREAARKILEGIGCAVQTAIDGEDGWSALCGGHYDLVVSDVDMPRLDGLGFVARLRADERFAKLPVLMVSYKDRAEDREHGLAAGANDYLAKSSLGGETFLRAAQKLLLNPA